MVDLVCNAEVTFQMSPGSVQCMMIRSYQFDTSLHLGFSDNQPESVDQFAFTFLNRICFFLDDCAETRWNS